MEPKRPLVREPFSGISHFFGAILSVVGLIVLLLAAHGRPWLTLGYAMFGGSLVLLYMTSALYHSLHVSPQRLNDLMHCDHSAIYLLIAGTYAPLCLEPLRTGWGLKLLAAEYLLALIGITCVFVFDSKPDWLRVLLYMGMGWLALLAMPALFHALSSAAMAWLIAGGLFYTIGTIFYATQRPRLWPGKFGAHDLWHVFVLAGSGCHFMMMLLI